MNSQLFIKMYLLQASFCILFLHIHKGVNVKCVSIYYINYVLVSVLDK